MRIADMFVKPIDRDIKGVIKVGQDDDANIYQELDEYVVTKELQKHFRSFFESYKNGISGHTDKMGVWISGFFGSGKSHFLKILSYLLENKDVNGKKAVEFFTDGSKLDDSLIMANIRLAENVPCDVILFNIDSKSESNSKSAKDAIMDVFMKVFNEMQGFCGSLPFLADLERKLADDGNFDSFKTAYLEAYGNTWEDTREDFYFIQDELVAVLAKQGIMSEEAARTWCEKSADTYTLSIEKFASLIRQYCHKKGSNHHVVFMVDEIGQYIAEDPRLMLNLQTVTENLGTACGGKAWVVVTSQQDIDSVVAVKGNDFSKIQGRFDTRLSLSSSNVDEVIRKRILEKNQAGMVTLELYYDQKESIIKNLIIFSGEVEKKLYRDRDEFAGVYPFIPYQFNLLGQVLTAIRTHSASGKHLAEGERSMIALFKESAMSLMEEAEGAIVPFYTFYNALDQFIDHTHRIVIKQAEENTLLESQDVELLKILFMIKHVKEIKANTENLTTLMVSNVDDDRINLRKKVEVSLGRLITQTLVQKNGDIYMFLTNEEQDINRAIQNETVEMGEIINEAAAIIFQEIIKENKYRYNNRYHFPYNQIVDGRYFKNNQSEEMAVHIITPYHEEDYKTETLRMLSAQKPQVLVQLPGDATFLDEIMETLKISKFMTKQGVALEKNFGSIKRAKQDELIEKKQRIRIFIEEAIKNAAIYVSGDKTNIPAKDPESRISDGLAKLVNTRYNKLYYMETQPLASDIEQIFKSTNQLSMGTTTAPAANNLALEDLLNAIELLSRHTKISLKSLIKHFSEAPYGFIDWDVRWLAAMLFKQGKASLILNSETLSPVETDPKELVRVMTKPEFADKLLIKKREHPTVTQIKSVKEVMKGLFAMTAIDDEEDTIMKTFKARAINKLREIDALLIEYRFEKRYPGKSVLLNGKAMLESILTIKNALIFFKHVHDQRDDLLDLSDDLEPIISFFNSEQKKILKTAFKYMDIYENSKNYIVDEELKDNIEEIRLVAKKPSPYNAIFKLPDALSRYAKRHSALIAVEVEPIRELVLNDEREVLAQLTPTEVKEKFESHYLKIFRELIDKLEGSNEIATVKNIRYESETLKERFTHEIVAYKNTLVVVYPPSESGEVAVNEPPEIIKTTKIVKLKTMKIPTTVTIETESDVEAFIQTVKSELLNELNRSDDMIINLTI
ncbi:BREX system P-loop protein BrxC [Acetobacterium carbinolicum]|uniref:BREX system P-loop protein BrxC n=1 Tax=Acetobacterium carbinolicum TaxID=52690 RepID=UPI0039C9CE19